MVLFVRTGGRIVIKGEMTIPTHIPSRRVAPHRYDRAFSLFVKRPQFNRLRNCVSMRIGRGPDQVFEFITELVRPIGTYLYGRRLYQTMACWGAPVDGYPPEHRDFAQVWQRAAKIIFSRTLTGVTTRNTRVERDFDVEAIRKLKRGVGA